MPNALALSLTHSISSNKPFLIKAFGVSYSWGGAPPPPSNDFFRNSPSIKTNAPHGEPPTPLKNEDPPPPTEKQASPLIET